MSQIEGLLHPYNGEIKDIKPAHALGGDGSDPIALIARGKGELVSDILPLPLDHNFRAGDSVVVTPEVTMLGKGMKIIYLLTPAPVN